MIDAFSQKPELLLVIFLLGMAAGLLLAAWIIQVCTLVGRYLERWKHAMGEQAALHALEVEVVEVDDVGMLCAMCWEARHPGLAWSLRRRSLCMEHLLSAGEPEPEQDPVLEPSR